MRRLLFILLFLVFWLPCLLFTSGSASLSPPLPAVETMRGPYDWHKLGMGFRFDGVMPDMLIKGVRELPDKSGILFALHGDFIEWLYGGGHMQHHIKLGKVYDSGIAARPVVSDWDIEHDAGLTHRIGSLRFNGFFIPSLLMSLALPILFYFWLMADAITVMTPEERKRRDDAFVELVQLVEARAKNDPAWLRRKTVRLAFLGYLVVFGSILLMIPLGLGLGAAVMVMTGGNAATAKLAFIVAAVPIGFAFHMGRSLLLQKFPPLGIEVTRKDAPALFDWLDKMIAAAKGPRFARVFISHELNASVSRNTGALGFFGLGPVELTLGLPLMQALMLPQLGAVIGHEYGHVAARDNALGQWVYRIRNSWVGLGQQLQSEKLWYALRLNRFYDWFIGVFSAYSFALSRRCEYEADAFSARIAGAMENASALTAVAVRAEELNRLFWLPLWKEAHNSPDVGTIRPYEKLPAFFAEPRQQAEAIEAVRQQETDYASTHPSTMDRVRAINHDFIEPEPVAISAARELLGQAFEHRLSERFSLHWQSQAAPHWQAKFDEHARTREKMIELRKKTLAEMTRAELGELIQAADHLLEDDAIIEASEEILRREPGSPGARMNLMGLKLEHHGDEGQIEHLDRFMQEHPQYLPNVCRHIIAHYTKTKRPDAAKPYAEKVTAWEYERQAAADERAMVLETDEFEAADLPADTLAQIAAAAARHKSVKTIFVAKKKVKYLPEFPSYVLAFSLKSMGFRSEKKQVEDFRAFARELQLPPDVTFAALVRVPGLAAKLGKISGAKLYPPLK